MPSAGAENVAQGQYIEIRHSRTSREGARFV